MMKHLLWIGFLVLACSVFSCQKTSPVVEAPVSDHVADKTEASSEEEEDVFFYNYAPTVDAKKEDILKALQGEWSSKENGFNYKIIILRFCVKFQSSDAVHRNK